MGGGKRRRAKYPTYNSVMAGEMGFARLAPEDLVGVEVDVVREPHPCCLVGRERQVKGRVWVHRWVPV